MIRVQMYLPADLYESIKLEAKKKKMSFAGYVRLHFESFGLGKEQKEKTLEERLPFLKYAGSFNLSKNPFDNDALDEALYGANPL